MYIYIHSGALSVVQAVSNRSGIWCLLFCYYLPEVRALENVLGVAPLVDRLKLSTKHSCPQHLGTRKTLRFAESLSRELFQYLRSIWVKRSALPEFWGPRGF